MEGSTPSMPQYVFNQWYHAASPIARARGVTIAFRKSCPWKLGSLQIDPEGRFLFVKGTLHSQCYTFASIYAPNKGTVNFLAKTLRMLEKFREGCLILGGDFNLTLDPSVELHCPLEP